MIRLVLEGNGRVWDETFVDDKNIDSKIDTLNQAAIALGASARWRRADTDDVITGLDDAFTMITDICRKYNLAMVAVLGERSHVGSLGRQFVYGVQPHWMPKEYMQILKNLAPNDRSLDDVEGVTYLTPVTVSKN